MTWNAAWRRKRFKPAGVLAWTMMAAGAAAIVYALAVSEAEGIPGWEPVNGAVREALAAEEEARPGSPEGAASSPSATAPSTVKPASPPETASSPLLDLNAATEAELDALPGIGPAKAKSIIAYREAGGAFRAVDDLLKVKGIGPKLLEQIRPFVRTGSPEVP